MRLALGLAFMAACTDESDPCAGLEGMCVALRVESQPTFDELELGITIAGQQSIVTRTTSGTVAPFIVPIEVAGQPIALDVVAVGRTGQTVMAAGAVTVDASGDRTDVTLVLMTPLTCVDTGYYCGGDKLYGDPTILYTCNEGGVPVLRERCEQTCTVAPPGTDDFCAD